MDYRELDALIDQLSVMVNDSDPQKGYWRQLWTLSKQIGAGFKGLRYPTKEDKDAAWQRYQTLYELAQERSEKSRLEMVKRQQEWQERKSQSEQIKGRIESKAYGSRPVSNFERSIADMVLLPIKVAERAIEILLGIPEKSQFEEIREELKGCNERLREAWRTFIENKADLLPSDRSKCYEALQTAQEKIDEAWTRLKQAGDEYFQAKRVAWLEKQQNFRERVHANISRLEEKLDRARAALGRQEAHLDKLRDDYSGAWNEEFKERCSGWIEETEQRINDINESIERLEGWLQGEREKLQ